MRKYMPLGLFLYLVLGGCSGGDHAIPSAAPARASNSILPGGVVESSSITGMSTEQLTVSAYSQPNSFVNRYSIDSHKLLQTIKPNIGYFRFPYESADDRYLILPGNSATAVYGTDGSIFTIQRDSFQAGTAMSTDNSTFATFKDSPDDQSVQIVTEYREPFRAPSANVSFTIGDGNYLYALNNDGSQAIGNVGSLPQPCIVVATLRTKSVKTPCWNDGYVAASGFEAFDSRHSWFYVGGEVYDGNYGPLNRVEIINTVNDKYLGYINLPGSAQSMTVNQKTSDLYVAVSNNIYVYNIPSCGCTRPRRILHSPIANPDVAIDTLDEHLFLYQRVVGPSKIIDENALTGAVQATYCENDSVSGVLAQ